MDKETLKKAVILEERIKKLQFAVDILRDDMLIIIKYKIPFGDERSLLLLKNDEVMELKDMFAYYLAKSEEEFKKL